MMQPAGSSSMMQRLMGVITLKAPIYKEIAEDPAALTPAAIITVAASVISGLFGLLLGQPIMSLVAGVLSALLGWIVSAFVASFVAERQGGKTNTQEMLRVLGHTNIFQILNFIPCLGTIAAIILGAIAFVIAVREAAEFDTQKAVITAVITFIAIFLVSLLIGTILGVGSAAVGAITTPTR